MKLIFLGLSLIAIFSMNEKSIDGGIVNACVVIDELITEINQIETISNKTTYLKKLERAKDQAEKKNWPLVKEYLNSFSVTVSNSSVRVLKLSQKESILGKTKTVIEAVNKKKAVCG